MIEPEPLKSLMKPPGALGESRTARGIQPFQGLWRPHVKKGERAIRVGTLIPVWRNDEKTGEKVQAGHCWHRAYVFALPQVQRSPYHRRYNDSGLPISAYPPVQP